MGERIETIAGAETTLDEMRDKAMKVARFVDESGRMDLHPAMMLIADLCDETKGGLTDTETLARVRNEAEDLDVHRERRAELRAVKDDEDSEREEARKVGRETL